MPSVTVSGRRLDYRVKDRRKANDLLLIHGAGMDGGFWDGVTERVAAANVYVPDLPGHGASGGTCLDSVEAYAESIAGLVDTLGLRRAVLGGHSMGGAVALVVALRRPYWLKGIVLAASGARLRVAPALFDKLAGDFSGAVEMIIGAMYPPDTSSQVLDAERRRYRRAVVDDLIRDYRACDAFDIMDRLGEIEVPTLILAAEDDRLTPAKYAAFLRDHIAGAQTRVLAEGGHAFPSLFPATVADALDAFVGSIDE